MNNKERAKLLREAAGYFLSQPMATDDTLIRSREFRAMADELDPPKLERWERVRDAYLDTNGNNEACWRLATAAATEGMIDAEKLRAFCVKNTPDGDGEWERGERAVLNLIICELDAGSFAGDSQRGGLRCERDAAGRCSRDGRD